MKNLIFPILLLSLTFYPKIIIAQEQNKPNYTSRKSEDVFGTYIRFEKYSDSLCRDSQQTLDRFCNRFICLQDSLYDLSILIHGCSCPEELKRDSTIGYRRAMAVKKYLKRNLHQFMKPSYYSDSEPLFSCKDEKGYLVITIAHL